MTSSFVAPALRRRTLLAGVVAAALGAGALAAPSAHAAFTLNECEGSTFAAQGSSFQNTLQASMKTLFEQSFGCNGAPAGPTYKSNGSGNGNAAMGAGGGNATINCAPGCTNNPAPAGQRDTTTRLSGTDEPPNPTQMSNINAGTASASDDGVIHVIPIATGASTLIVHAPEGCDLSTVTNKTNGTDATVGGADTGDAASNHTQRIRLISALVEKAFAGASDADTWGEIAPGISGTPSNAQETGIANCTDVPVKRIVRSDNSGTTYSWKAYLNLINSGRGWITTYNPSPNTVWPQAGGAGTASPTLSAAACPNSEANHLCANTATGGGALADLVNLTDGSIGYVDLATARSKGFDVTPHVLPGDTAQDYTFWIPLQNNPGGSATGYAEPTANPGAHTTSNTTKGANCSNATIANVPTPAGSPGGDPTRGDWSAAYAAGGASFPACVVTYVLAWDDNAPVYGNTPDEQAKARSVKDYLQKILVGSVGQAALFGADYSQLPNGAGAPLLTYAQNAVNAIGWNKAAGNGGGGGGGGNGGGGGGGGGNNPPPPGPPSNAFSIPSHTVSSSLLSFSLELPGKGQLKVLATAKAGKKTLTVAKVTATTTGSGRVKVKLTLSKAARKALAKAKSHKLKVVVKFTFTPTGGSARTVKQTVTVKAPKKHKKVHR